MAGAAVIGASPLLVRVSELGGVAVGFWRVALALPLLALWFARSRPPREAIAATASGRGSHLTDGASPAPAANPANATCATCATCATRATRATCAARATRALGGPALIVLAGLLFAADLALWNSSVRLTSIANSTFLVNIAPLVVALVLWAMRGQRPRSAFVVGMVLALAGSALLLRSSLGASRQALAGDLMALGAALALAGYMIALRDLRSRHGTAAIMFGSSVVTAAVLLPAAALIEARIVPGTAREWLILLVLALACHAGGQGLIAYSLARLGAAFSSLGLLIEPVVAALLAWWLLGESMSALQIAGSGAVVAGIALAARDPH